MTAEEKKIRVKLKKIQNTIQALREESLRLLEVNASILPKDYTPDSLSEWRKRKSENQKVIDNNNESISDLQQMTLNPSPRRFPVVRTWLTGFMKEKVINTRTLFRPRMRPKTM